MQVEKKRQRLIIPEQGIRGELNGKLTSLDN
jgi:hypothetical protein